MLHSSGTTSAVGLRPAGRISIESNRCGGSGSTSKLRPNSTDSFSTSAKTVSPSAVTSTEVGVMVPSIWRAPRSCAHDSSKEATLSGVRYVSTKLSIDSRSPAL